MEPNDLPLTQQHELLPLVRHPLHAFKCGHRVEDLAAEVMMRPKEVVVGDPEREIKIGILVAVITAGASVRSLESTVETLNQLLVRTELFRDFIVIGEADDLGDVKTKTFPESLLELHGSEWIGAVTISNESEAFRKLVSEMRKSLPHGEDAGTDAAVIRASVAKDGAFYGIHDEPDIAFLAANLDVGFIGGEVAGRLVIVMVYKRLDEHSCSLAVIGDLLMRDPDAVNVPQNVFGTAERNLVVDVVCEAEGDDLHGELVEPEGRCVLGK